MLIWRRVSGGLAWPSKRRGPLCSVPRTAPRWQPRRWRLRERSAAGEVMQPLVLIPCKSFAAGKSRLSTVLSPERRDALCRSLLINTIDLAASLVARGHIYVVSSDSNVTSVASDLGVHCHGQNDIDLNSALTWSVAKFLAREHENLERNIL